MKISLVQRALLTFVLCSSSAAAVPSSSDDANHSTSSVSPVTQIPNAPLLNPPPLDPNATTTLASTWLTSSAAVPLFNLSSTFETHTSTAPSSDNDILSLTSSNSTGTSSSTGLASVGDIASLNVSDVPQSTALDSSLNLSSDSSRAPVAHSMTNLGPFTNTSQSWSNNRESGKTEPVLQFSKTSDAPLPTERFANHTVLRSSETILPPSIVIVSSPSGTTSPSSVTSPQAFGAALSTSGASSLASVTRSSSTGTSLLASGIRLSSTGTSSPALGTRSSSTSTSSPALGTRSSSAGTSSPPSGIIPPLFAVTSSLPSGTSLPPPAVTFLTTDDEVQSGASNLSILIVPIFPLLQSWMKNPRGDVTPITNELNKILPQAISLLRKLPEPPGPVEPCKKMSRRLVLGQNYVLHERDLIKNIFKTAFSLVKCIKDSMEKIKDTVTTKAEDVEGKIKTLTTDLAPMVDMLKAANPEKEPSGPRSNEPTTARSTSVRSTSARSTSSSSSSCTPRTVSNCNIACIVISTATAVGRVAKRADTKSCSTKCGPPITKCDATGVTSASTVTSTTTTKIYEPCSPDCTECVSNQYDRLKEVPKGFLTASNGALYKPVPTGQVSTIRARSLQETRELQHRNISRRAFSNYNDEPWKGKFPSISAL